MIFFQNLLLTPLLLLPTPTALANDNLLFLLLLPHFKIVEFLMMIFKVFFKAKRKIGVPTTQKSCSPLSAERFSVN